MGAFFGDEYGLGEWGAVGRGYTGVSGESTNGRIAQRLSIVGSRLGCRLTASMCKHEWAPFDKLRVSGEIGWIVERSCVSEVVDAGLGVTGLLGGYANRMRDMARNRFWQLALQHCQRGICPILVDRVLRTRG